MKANFKVKKRIGLGDVFEHYIDGQGFKYFTGYNACHGSFLRQVQTDRITLDCSDGKPYEEKMIMLGFDMNSNGLFMAYDNRSRFLYHVYGSNNGVPKNPVSIAFGGG